MTSGKLAPELLKKLVLDCCAQDDHLVIGPGVGEDAAVLKTPQEPYWVVASDPITGAHQGAGTLLVDVNVNDLVCKGATPRWMTVTILTPQSCEQQIHELMVEISQRAAQLGVTIVGGHTEMHQSFSTLVLSATIFGTANRLLSATNIQPDDRLLMTKSVGLEGMSILAYDRPDLLQPVLTDREIDKVKGWRSLLSVLPEGRILEPYATLMHDPTEGGFLGGLSEMVSMSGLGFSFEKDNVLIDPLTSKVAAHLHFDPLKLIASGTLLAVVQPKDVDVVQQKLTQAGIDSAVVGRFTTEDSFCDLSHHEELWRLLSMERSVAK